MSRYRGKDSRGGHEANVESDFYLVLQEAVAAKEIPQFHTRKQIPLLWSEPDFTWDEEKTALYWDGPPHDKAKQGAKDDLQNDYLIHLRWKVIRIHYDGGKVSQEKKNRALQWVIEVLADSRMGKLWEYDLEAVQ